MPNFHGFGLSVCMHTPFTLGMCSILVPQFDAKRFDKLFTSYHPTIVAGVPTLYEALLKTKLGKNELSCLKCVVSGGDTMNPEFKKQIDEFLKKHCLLQQVLR